jgi:hypothetical protein
MDAVIPEAGYDADLLRTFLLMVFLVEFPALDFTGTLTRPAFSRAVAVSAGAGSLAILALFFVFDLLDTVVRIVFSTRFSCSRAIAKGTFTGMAGTIETFSRIDRAEGALFFIVSFFTFVHARRAGGGSERGYCGDKVSSFHGV